MIIKVPLSAGIYRQPHRCFHETTRWNDLDIDIGILDFVIYLNSIPGVHSHSSCQGDPEGKKGPPFNGYVLVTWDNDEAFKRLQDEFGIPHDPTVDWRYIGVSHFKK